MLVTYLRHYVCRDESFDLGDDWVPRENRLELFVKQCRDSAIYNLEMSRKKILERVFNLGDDEVPKEQPAIACNLFQENKTPSWAEELSWRINQSSLLAASSARRSTYGVAGALNWQSVGR